MPTRRESIYITDEHNKKVLVFDVDEVSHSSPRKNGLLILAQQPYSRKMAKLIIGTAGSKSAGYPNCSVYLDRRFPESLNWASIDNVALAKFNGKLRYGSASLGVTLGSWRESRDMIVRRSKDLGDSADRAREALRRNPGWLRYLRKGKRDPLANQVLEYKFGWEPLFTDIRTALTTVCSDAIPPEFVKSRHRRHVTEKTHFIEPYGWDRQEWEGLAMTTVSARVSISNPNLWLLNRMGLLNPATIAWDLVPWSFVVNMFVNANAMIGSVTDHVGLQIDDKATTRTWKGINHSQSFNSFFPKDGYSDNRVLFSDKKRIVGSIPSYSWEFKVPSLNWDLAVTAASLALQKIKKLNSLIRGI